MQLSDLPAKSDGTTVTEHTEHVVIAAEELLKRLPITNEERLSWHQIIRECAVLHDVGKIHPYFQANLNAETTIFPIRHEIVSLWIISAYIEEVSDIQAFAIATHHKGIMDSLSPFKSRLSQDIQNDLSEQIALNDFQKIIPYIPELLNKWIEKFNVFIKLKLVPELEANIIQPQLWQLLKKNFQPKQLPSLRKQLAETRGLLIASDHIGSAKEHNNIPKPPIITFDTFVPRDNEGNVLPFREFQADLQQVNGDVLLYAPTGSGKTEAALNWLVNNQELNARFFYLLPYTASINAMVKRLEKIFGKEQVTALHSKTLDFFYERLENEEWDDTSESKTARHARNAAKAKSMKHLSREIFYPAKVATPHQILKNALMGKGWEMSLFDYRKACFVIDEFHAYEPLLTGLLLATLHWLKKHFEARIFFMSATIPSFLKELIIKEVFKGDTSVYREPINDANRPLDQVILDQKRHRVICHDNKSVDASLSIIKGLLAEGKSVLVIVNNVKTCQDIFEKTDFDGFKQMLHGGFNREDRVKIENNITNEDITKRPQLLVATQAIEVSLDIDYDLAFIENAPIDALIQRLGRVNRKGLKGIVSIHLFEKIIGNTPFYSKDVLIKTWQNLKILENQDLSEADLVYACDKVYEEGYTEEQWKDFNQGFQNSTINQFFEKLIAADWRDWVEEVIENQNMKVDILCGNLTDKFDQYRKEGDFIRANQLLVSVYRYELDKTVYQKDEKRKVIVAYDFIYECDTGYKKKVDSIDERIL